MYRIIQTETSLNHCARLFRVANGLLGDVYPVGNGINELRIHYGPGYRDLF